MRTYETVLELLIKASERFYMLRPRCVPLLAGTDCFGATLPADRRLARPS